MVRNQVAQSGYKQQLLYHKTSDRSRAPDRRRDQHTGRGFDWFVLIEAGPQLQAGFRIQAKVGYRQLHMGVILTLLISLLIRYTPMF